MHPGGMFQCKTLPAGLLGHVHSTSRQEVWVMLLMMARKQLETGREVAQVDQRTEQENGSCAVIPGIYAGNSLIGTVM